MTIFLWLIQWIGRARYCLRLGFSIATTMGLVFLAACGPPPVLHVGPTLASPNVTRVCVRPPNVPPNTQWWGLTEGGHVLFAGWEIKIAQENGLRVYYFDADAPPESAQRLPIPHNDLECPARILPAAQILPWKEEVVAKRPVEEEPIEKEEAKAEAEKPAAPKDPEEERFRQWAAEINQKKAIAAPPIVNQRPMPARAASTGCKEVSEPGQKRKRTSTSSCTRTRTLIHEARAADPPPAIAAPTSPRPIPKPLPEPVPAEYEPRRTQPPDLPGLDPDRAIECLNGICHQRHQNFRPKNQKPAKPGDGQAWSTGGKAKPPGSKTTVKTRTSPLSRPNNGQTKAGAPKKKTGPKTDENAPHNSKIREEANKLEAEGNTIVKGGRGGRKEEVVDIKGGLKKTRRPDITYETPDGKRLGRNVGQTKADGTPVKREQEALDDLNKHSKRPTDFAPYDR